jgi:hypothetical protein
MKPIRPLMHDDNGDPAIAGDRIVFKVGIPGRMVYGRITIENGKLWVDIEGDNEPKRMKLRSLRRFVDCWYLAEDQDTPPRG